MNKKTQKTVFSSNKDDWATPWEIVEEYRAKGFAFRLDPAATRATAKAPLCYTKEENGLEQDWYPYSPVFCNPPYGRGVTGLWVKKAVDEMELGCTSVPLLPARTDNVWWHKYIWDRERGRPRRHREVDFRKGRIKFVGAPHGAPFPSVIVTFWGKEGF